MKLSDIKLNPDNPRLIKDNKFKKLVASIKDFPKMMELRPIVVDTSMSILGGNMRYNALRAAGYSEIDDNWVKIADKLTDEEKKRFIIEDNMPFGEWDWDILGNQFEINDLLEWGFNEDELKIEKEIIEDEVPELSNEPVISKLGEVYQLGRHKLMCGDSTKIEDIKKLMDGKKEDMVYTDPPYNVNVNYEKGGEKIFNDNLSPEDYKKFCDSFIANLALVTKNGAGVYIWTGWWYYEVVKQAFMDSDFKFSQPIIWDKGQFVLSHGYDYHRQFEHGFYGWKGKKTERYFNPNVHNASDVWRIQKDFTGNYVHPTQKLVSLAVIPIKNSSKEEDIVIDIFGGSGSTLIACEQTNRTCYMMEIDPKYCDVIRKRYAKFIGKEEKWQTITPVIL